MSILNGASSNVPLFPKQAPTGLEGANGLVDQIAIDQTGESSLLTPPLDGADIPAGRDAPFDPYSYQIEMFEQSLHRNIIVAVGEPHDLEDRLSDGYIDGYREWQDTYVCDYSMSSSCNFLSTSPRISMRASALSLL